MRNALKLIMFRYASCQASNSSFSRGLSTPKLFRSSTFYTGTQCLRTLHVGARLNDQPALNVENTLSKSQSEKEPDQLSEELDAKVKKYESLAKDVETKKKILMFLMEHEVAKLEGKRVPSKITVDDMQELLTLFSYSSRIKYMSYLFVRETAKSTEKRRRELKKKEREVWLLEKQNIKPSEHLTYGIGHNTLLIRVRRRSVMRHFNERLASAVLHGQKFIVDMDYDCFMRKQDCHNCGEQLLELYSVNRKNKYPFDLYMCNVQHSSTTMKAFAKYMPNIYAPDNFLTLTDMSYLDVFPKDKLVFITPHAKESMKTFDHDAIYVIGGLVDKCIREPVVMAKAKREGVRSVYIPFEQYLLWGRGSKSLPLNHLMNILLEMKRTGDWDKAFKHVPQRKLVRSLDSFSDF